MSQARSPIRDREVVSVDSIGRVNERIDRTISD
jgi:hypothetical protein